jgi:hypothetical protein
LTLGVEQGVGLEFQVLAGRWRLVRRGGFLLGGKDLVALFQRGVDECLLGLVQCAALAEILESFDSTWSDVPERLAALTTPAEFFALLEARGV